MKKLLTTTFLVLMGVVSAVAANVIHYTATAQVVPYATNVFGATYQSSTFDASTGKGTLNFAGDVTSIGYSAFEDCSSLQSITLPASVTGIGSRAFWRCSQLKSITIPEGITRIEDYTFEYCGQLEEVHLPYSLTSIGPKAFNGCSQLKSIHIPEGVTRIENSGFEYCSSLETVILPTTITELGDYCFQFSTIGELRIEATTPPSVGGYVFYGATIGSIYVPCESLEAYQNHSAWQGYSNIMHGLSTYIRAISSSDHTLGLVNVLQQPTCENNYQIIVQATAKEGCVFTQWSDGSTDNPRTLTLDNATSLQAQFERVFPQPEEPGMRMKITMKNGTILEASINDIQDIQYNQKQDTQQ